MFHLLTVLALMADTPVPRAHAHNDYAHTRPLLDALDQGFHSVEADIFLTERGLQVGHTTFDLKPERTLEKLYLDPLRQRVRANGGKVYKDGLEFYLLIDVKTEAKKTYAALALVLEQYAEMLTVVRGGKVEPNAVTVVVSGNCDRAALTEQKVRYAAIDGRPGDLGSDAPAHLIPWVSASWSSQFQWNGTGPISPAERTKLRDFVAQAHQRGRLVRFWATPEKVDVWRELADAGMDLINTDKLAELSEFLRKK